MFRSLSLTTRLTLFFTLAAAAVVFGLALLVIAASERHFIELDHMALQDKQHLIEDILARSNSAEDAKWLLREALSHHHGLYVSVHDSKGETLFQSEGFRLPRELSLDRPAFRRHPDAIIHGNDRGVYGQQQAVHG